MFDYYIYATIKMLGKVNSYCFIGFFNGNRQSKRASRQIKDFMYGLSPYYPVPVQNLFTYVLSPSKWVSMEILWPGDTAN